MKGKAVTGSQPPPDCPVLAAQTGPTILRAVSAPGGFLLEPALCCPKPLLDPAQP